MILVSLRTSDGFSLNSLESWPERFAVDFMSQLQPLISGGIVINDNGAIKIPKEKWLTSDAVMRELILSY